MYQRLVRIASGVLAILCVNAPISATVVSTPHTRLNPITVNRHMLFKTVTIGKKSLSIPLPPGCASNGPNSFLGELGPTSSLPETNFAGGTTGSTPTGYAGVLAGVGNQACDYLSATGAGSTNVIGGDATAQASFIGGGLQNDIEGAPYAVIGGGSGNIINGNVNYPEASQNSVIAGGSSNISTGAGDTFIGAGMNNLIEETNYSTGEAIVAGANNNMGGSANSFIASGTGNSILGSASAVIVGGDNNTVTLAEPNGGANDSAIISGVNNIIGNASSSTIVGGQGNGMRPPGRGSMSDSVISGGSGNSSSASYAVIGGGFANSAMGEYATIGGGNSNSAAGAQSSVSGGYGNVASGKDAAVPGGTTNTASGTNSFAAGTKSTAGYTGDFVWSDYVSGSGGVAATAAGQFVARATGGFYLYTSTTGAGVKLASGSGSWSTLSDRNVKTGVASVDDARILAKLATMPVSEWSYKAQGTSVRHVGPMAQDFRAAFGLGEDDRHISTVDEEGVALAAIKALQSQLAEKNRQLADTRRTVSDLGAKYARLEERLDALEARSRTAATKSATPKS